MPVILNPTNSSADIDAAIDGTIDIAGIKSKLIRHFQPESIAKRGTYTGAAKIEKNGKNVSLSYNFGNKAQEALATPIAEIAFEVASKKGKFDSITITSFVADNSKIDMKLSK